MGVEISDNSYLKIIQALSLIHRMQEYTKEIKATYFSTATIDSPFGDSLKQHYSERTFNDFSKDLSTNDKDLGLGKLINDILANQSFLLVHSCYNIPADYINSAHPNAQKIFDINRKMTEQLKIMSDDLADRTSDLITDLVDKVRPK